LEIIAKGIGKKFGNEWIIRDFNYHFQAGKKYAIVGGNGSGKSTLLKLISGSVLSNEGKISYWSNNQELEDPSDSVFNKIAWVAPYIELVEEMTVVELFNFYTGFKQITISLSEFLEELNFSSAKNKPVANFSSGMKQRLQLGLAVFSDAKFLLLDEPTSNLDEENINWYIQLLSKNMDDRVVLISSNQKHEYNFCDEQIKISDFKKKNNS
jgi:ABC-type multidrug transport system ATPase subunit